MGRRSLHGELPTAYQHSLRFEFDRRVASALRPGITILDVGSGRHPSIARESMPAGCTYVGLDVSAAELEAAGADAYDRAVVADVTSRVDDLVCQFDLVLSFQVLEHVRPLAGAFENLRQYLRPGGRLVAQLSGGLTPFAMLGRVVPHRLALPVLEHLLHRDPEKVFPAHYDHCRASAIRSMLAAWSQANVVPLHRGASYFHFAKPLRAGYLMYEEWLQDRHLDDLASYYIVDAVR